MDESNGGEDVVILNDDDDDNNEAVISDDNMPVDDSCAVIKEVTMVAKRYMEDVLHSQALDKNCKEDSSDIVVIEDGKKAEEKLSDFKSAQKQNMKLDFGKNGSQVQSEKEILDIKDKEEEEVFVEDVKFVHSTTNRTTTKQILETQRNKSLNVSECIVIDDDDCSDAVRKKRKRNLDYEVKLSRHSSVEDDDITVVPMKTTKMDPEAELSSSNIMQTTKTEEFYRTGFTDFQDFQLFGNNLEQQFSVIGLKKNLMEKLSEPLSSVTEEPNSADDLSRDCEEVLYAELKPMQVDQSYYEENYQHEEQVSPMIQLSVDAMKKNIKEKLAQPFQNELRPDNDTVGLFEGDYYPENEEYSELVVADQFSNDSDSDEPETVDISLNSLKNSLREKISRSVNKEPISKDGQPQKSVQRTRKRSPLHPKRSYSRTKASVAPDIDQSQKNKSHSCIISQNQKSTGTPLNQQIIEKVRGRLLTVTLPFISSKASASHPEPAYRLKHATNVNRVRRKKLEQNDFGGSDTDEGFAVQRQIISKKYEHFVHIIIVPNERKQNVLSFQALCQLKAEIAAARNDPSCKLLLLSSSGTYFCSGLELTWLVGPNKEQAVALLAHAVSTFIKALATFPKPIVAAVNGITVGLGVILLTYCDVVFASESATFCTPYCKLGYIPEGAGTLTLSQVVGVRLASEMLLRGRKLTSAEALASGLVSEVFWSDMFIDEVMVRVEAMAKQSYKGMELTKCLVRSQMWNKVEATIDKEVTILSKQWMSPGCQKAMKFALNGVYYIT